MSSFSSVVQKPGKKIVPKVAPRRNIARKNVTNTVAAVLPSVPAASTEEPEIEHTQPSQPVASEIGEIVAQDIQDHTNDLSHDTSPEVTVGSQDKAAHTLEREHAVPDVLCNTADSRPPEFSQTDRALSAEVENDNSTNRNVSINATIPEQSQDKDTTRPIFRDNPRQETVETLTEVQNIIQPSRSSKTRKQPSDHRDTPLSPRKRRKVTPPTISTSQSTDDPSTLQTNDLVQPLPTTHTLQDTPTHPTDDLLASATRGAASVSEMASDIESRTRALRPRKARDSNTVSEMVESSNLSEPSSSRPRTRRRKKTTIEQAAEVVANAVGKSVDALPRRDATPEDAESYELEPAKTTMGELCQDRRLGKKSTLEFEMEANWAEILQRRKEDRERALENAEKHRRKGFSAKFQLPASTEIVAALAPSMTVVNGVIVVDQASREIDRGAQLQQAAIEDLDHVREDRNYYKYVHQGTVGMKPGQGQHSKWDDESTELFFKGLRMFGTDFLMIANMFPGVTRRQIKAKFNREEEKDKLRIRECLKNRELAQIEDYATLANKEAGDFYTMESIQKELDEQEKRLRDEDNQRRKQEGFLTTSAEEENAQSTERGVGEGSERQTQSIEPGRFDEEARGIVAAAMTTKKQRKTTATSSKKGLKHSRRPEGGIEEILGSIDEVAV